MKYYTVENSQKSIFKTFAIYYICMAVFCLVRILASVGLIAGGKVGSIVFTFVIQILILFLLPLFLYCVFLKVKPKQVFKTCNFNSINFVSIIISIVIGILCFIINIAVSSLFNGILTYTGYRFGSSGVAGDYSTPNFFLDILLVAVLPAFAEEFLHRGIVLQGTKHMGFKRAIVLSSLLFGLMHFNIQQVAYAFVIGLILGFVAVVSKNIYPAMIIHFVNNFISTYIDYASNRGWIFGDIFERLQNALSAGNAIGIIVIVSISLIVVVVLLCLYVWLLYKQSMLRKVKKAINKVYNDYSYNYDSPVVVDKDQEIKDLLEKNTLLNLTYKKMDNPIDIVLPKEKYRYKVKAIDNLFLWGSIMLGGLVTIFTYVWGLL